MIKGLTQLLCEDLVELRRENCAGKSIIMSQPWLAQGVSPSRTQKQGGLHQECQDTGNGTPEGRAGWDIEQEFL